MNPVSEIMPATYAIDLLAELDDLQWAERLGLANGLSEDELVMAIVERTGDYRAKRDEMITARIREVETLVYAVRRKGLSVNRAARAAGMRTGPLRRWLQSYDEGR